MIIGVPRERKPDEYRVALVPVGVELLRSRGHRVLVERTAGLGSSLPDEAYARAGAELVADAATVYAQSELILKVKEPLPDEVPLIRPGQTLFAFFHFAANGALVPPLLEKHVISLAYETVEDAHGGLPLLTPMSEVGGRMAIQEGAKYLEKPMEGRGILLGGVPGVLPASVVILGGGVVGSNAGKVAAGLGARVTILDTSLPRLRYLDDIMPKNVVTLMSNLETIRRSLTEADLVIGAALIRGGRAPILVTRALVAAMKPGSVIVDVSIDQGGCCETSRPTTHSRPTYVVDGVVHYCVANIPGAVAGTSTYALTNVTLPYVLELADRGIETAVRENAALGRGVNLCRGHVTYEALATALGVPSVPLAAALGRG